MRLRRTVPLPAPEPRTPWRSAEFCVIDLEATGLDLRRDEMVSFGAVIVREARIPVGRAVYRRLRPSRPSSAAALAVHGLRATDLADAPPLGDVLDELVALIAGRVPVAHAAWVERALLDRALRPLRLRLPAAVVDTAALLRACRLADAAPGREPDLERSARRLGLPVHTPHHALGDAFTTAQLLLALATRLEHGRTLTVGDLAALSNHHRQR